MDELAGDFVSPLLRQLMPAGLQTLVPNLLVTLAIAAVIAGTLGPHLRVRAWRVALWLFALTVPLAYTWSAAAGPASPGCHLGMPPWQFSVGGNNEEIVANIALFVPAGASAFLWEIGARRLAALTVGLAVPPAVELGQLLLPGLERVCQLGDVLNNQIGVLLGWSIVAGVWAGGRMRPGSDGGRRGLDAS